MSVPIKRFLPLLFVAAGLGGCLDTGSASAPAAGNTAELDARAACLREVGLQTGNPTLRILSSEFSEAGARVIVGVGAQEARWSCIAYRDGTTGGIMSLTDEGAA